LPSPILTSIVETTSIAKLIDLLLEEKNSAILSSSKIMAKNNQNND
jgi:hypothetical protein